MPSGNTPSTKTLYPRLVAAAFVTISGLCFGIAFRGESLTSASSQPISAVLMANVAPVLAPPAAGQAEDQSWPESLQLDHADVFELYPLYRSKLPITSDLAAAASDESQEGDPPPAPPAAPPDPPPPAVSHPAPQVQKPAAPIAPTATPPPPPAAVSLSALEQQVFDGQNSERVRAGLSALRIDAGLEAVARQRAQDMASRNYFSHVSPTGETAFSLIDAAGIKAPYAAENIGYNNYGDASSASAVLAAFMSSSTHRSNILSGVYSRVGLAVASAANGNKYYAVVFAGP